MEPRTVDLFTERFESCHIDESVYLILGGKPKKLRNETDWNSLSVSHLDPRKKSIWARSSKDNLFAEYCKSTVGYIY